MGGRRLRAYTAIGRLDGACPNCARDLPAWPTRSGPCQYCGAEIFVRTRPLDREKVLATEAEAAELEIQWELFRDRGGDLPLRPLLNEQELEDERANMRVRFEREPAEADVAASLISHRTFDHVRRLELGSYRDMGLAKASLQDQHGRAEDALAGYLGVCFLDLNGACNPPRQGEGAVPVSWTEAKRAFAPDQPFLTPVVVGRCIQIIAVLDQDEDAVRALYTAFCERHYKSLHPPRSPEGVWALLGEAIFGEWGD